MWHGRDLFEEDPSGKASVLWVALSANGTPPGQFTFRGTLAPLAGDRYFLASTRSCWYVEDVAEWETRLRAVMAARPYARTVFLGSSMGAYGALIHGARLGVERILAFAPHTRLGVPHSFHSFYHEAAPGEFADLRPLFPPGARTRPVIVMGARALIDGPFVADLQQDAGARFDARYLSCGHNVCAFLKRHGALRAMVASMASDAPFAPPTALIAGPSDLALNAELSSRLYALADEPEAADVVSGLAELAGQPKEYIEDFLSAVLGISTRERSPEAAMLIARAALAMEPKLRTGLAHTVKLAFQRRDFMGLDPHLQSYADMHGRTTESLMTALRAAFASGNLDLMGTFADELIATADDRELLTRVGRVCLKAQQPVRAAIALRLALALSPDATGELSRLLATAQLRAGQPRAALATLEASPPATRDAAGTRLLAAARKTAAANAASAVVELDNF